MLPHDWETQPYAYDGKKQDTACRACGALRSETADDGLCRERTKVIITHRIDKLADPIHGRRFAHEPVYTVQRGQVKVYCRCDAQSGLLETMETAQEVYRLHVGLKELEQKQLLH